MSSLKSGSMDLLVNSKQSASAICKDILEYSKPRKVKITAISEFIECETTLPQSKANKLIKALTKANNELNTTGTQGIKITIETL